MRKYFIILFIGLALFPVFGDYILSESYTDTREVDSTCTRWVQGGNGYYDVGYYESYSCKKTESYTTSSSYTIPMGVSPSGLNVIVDEIGVGSSNENVINSIETTKNQLLQNNQDAKHIDSLQKNVENSRLAAVNSKKLNAIKEERSKKIVSAGDPVRISSGEYFSTEVDLIISIGDINYPIKRYYQSNNHRDHSLGIGWSFSYDSRIIRGYEYDIQSYMEYLQTDIDLLINLLEEGKVLFSQKQSDVENVLTKIDSYILTITNTIDGLEKGLTLAPDRLKDDVASDLANARIVKQKIDAFQNKSVTSELELMELYPLISEIDTLLTSTISLLQQAKLKLDITNLNRTLNQYVTNASDPDFYTDQGCDTLVYIDDDGFPHSYRMLSSAVSLSVDESSGITNFFPCGSDTSSIEKYQPKLTMLSDGSYTLIEETGIIKHFSKYGLLTQICDNKNNSLNLKYDDNNILNTISDSYNHIYFLEYEKNKIHRIIGPEKMVVEYTFSSEHGQLSSVTDIDGDRTTYFYDYTDRLIKVEKPDLSEINIAYNVDGSDGIKMVTSTSHEEKANEYFEYYPDQKLTIYTNHSGLKYFYYYDDFQRVTYDKKPDGSTSSYTYNSETGLLEKIYINNYEINLLYDERGRLIKKIFPQDGSFEEWHWNELYQITYYRDRDGVVTENVYDQGNLTEVYKQINNFRTQTYWASYDQKGLLYQDRVGEQAVWTYSWNSQTGYLDNRTATINGTLVREQWTHDEIGRVTSFIDGENRKSTYIYNPKTSTELRNIVEITPDQLKRTLFYNSRKDLVSITEEDLVSKSSRRTTIKYDKRHLPVKIWNGEDLLTEYEYRADGKIVKEIRGPWSTEYIYNENTGDLSTVVKSAAKSPYSGDFSEYTTSYSSKYNSSGMLERSVSTASPASDSELSTTQYTYDAWNRVIAVTDGLQSVTRRKITPSGRVSAEQTEAGGWIGYSYDNAGLLSQAGKVSDSSWNSIQNPVSVIYNADGTIQKKTDRNNLETIYSYNELGLLKQEQTVAGSKTYEYDRAGRITRMGVKTTTPDSIKHPEIWTTWKYNDNSRTVSVTEGDLYTTVWTMDAWGNPIKRLNDNSKPVKWIYDSQGRLDFVVDQYSRVTKYTWNSIGKIHRIDYPDESFAEYTYDAIGNLLSITDNLGVSWAGRYNKAGLLEHETGRPGLDKRYEYDALGRLKIVKTGGVITEKYDYSINGNKISFSSGNGPSFNYNKNEYGELVSETNRNGDSRSFNYDAEGRLVSISNFSSSELETLHDDSTLVKTTKSREGIISEISSDFEGRVLKASSSTGTIYYKYNSAGWLIEQVDESAGETTQWTYNDKGQKTSMRSGNRDIRYEYGEAGELCSVTDNLQRLSVGFTFDELGREISRKYGNGVTQFTERDVIGRTIVVKEISATGELLRGEAYLYDDVGRRYLTITENGAVTRYCYDEQSRLSQVYYTYNDQIVALAKDEAECVGLSISMKASSPEVMSLTHQEYDLASALLNSMGLFRSSVIRQNLSAWKESFSYDDQGNRKTKTTAFGTIDYTYDDENRMITAGKVTYSYDKEGNLLSEKGARRTATYTYNTQNRMVSSKVTDIVKKQQIATDYAYDAFGRRTSVKDIGSSGMRTLYDGLSFDVIRESVTLNDNSFTSRFGENTVRRNESVTQTGRYAWIDDSTDQRSVYADDADEYSSIYTRYVGECTPLTVYGETVATARSSSKNTRGGGVYLGTDILGSMRSTTNEYGNIEERYEYDAFGTPYQGDFTTGVNAGYTGKAYDPITGLYNYGFRDYSPVLARFTTVDPIRDGRNWFTYVNNEPVNFRDPFGLSSSDAQAAMDISKLPYDVQKAMKSNYQNTKAEEFATILRSNVGKTYEDVGQCNGSVLNPLRQMGYEIPQGYNADAIAKGKVPGITIVTGEMSQSKPGVLNGYDWNKDGKIDHINAGVGQRPGETKPQVFDATENTVKPDGSDGINEKWTKGRNEGSPSNGQTTIATSGKANLTFEPFSYNTKPAVQLKIDFNVLNQNFGTK